MPNAKKTTMKQILLTIFLTVSLLTVGQNLVPNPSFEDTTQCPYSFGQIDFAFPWFNPNTASPDYFNTCGPVGVTPPNCIWGYQVPRTGNAFGEICVYGGGTPTSVREYVEVLLIDTLIQNKNYCVSFYVSHAGVSFFADQYTPIAVSEIGLYFSNNAITSTNYGPFFVMPQIVSPPGIFLNDTTQWTEISGIYTALGGERFITIGNFKDDLNTDTVVVDRPGFDPQGYYYLDDVSVIDCDLLNGITDNVKNKLINVYPNPTSDYATLEFTNKINFNYTYTLYDIFGRIIQQLTNIKSDKIRIGGNNLDNGIYFYHLCEDGVIITTDKLIIE